MCAKFCVNAQTVSSFKKILCSLIYGLAHTTVITIPLRNVHIFFSSYKALKSPSAFVKKKKKKKLYGSMFFVPFSLLSSIKQRHNTHLIFIF